jgi:regulator of sigma E protease
MEQARKDIASTFVIDRAGERQTFYIQPAPKDQAEPICEFVIKTYTFREHNPFVACAVGVKRSLMTASAIIRTLTSLVTGKLSTTTLGGPIFIAQIAYKTARVDFFYFLYFIALVSINLGIVNLLPIPVLDGGHLVFILFEKIKGSPVSEKVQGYAQWVGLAAIGLLIIFLFYNDIMRTLKF